MSVAPVRSWPDVVPDERFTLGWECAQFATDWLVQPDGPHAGDPFEYTREQLRMVLRWYELTPEGKFANRRGVVRRLKGWGKDPWAASLIWFEALGRCRFSHWSGDRLAAVQHPAPWVQVAAVSREQTRNTMTLLGPMLSKEAISEFGVDLGKEIIYFRGVGRIEAVTSSPRALEGGRPSFVLKNEALALDTPLPTPDGWTTVGDVAEGETIYGSRGPVTVTHVTQVYEGRPCFTVSFDDGTSIVADEGHLWGTYVAASAARYAVRTTREMYEDGRRFQVPNLVPDAGVEKVLPVDPYVFGLWLGDGSKQDTTITTSSGDLDHVVSQVEAAGYIAHVTPPSGDRTAHRVSVRTAGARRNRNDPRPPGFRAQLSELGVLGNKHIPDVFMRASLRQRLALIQGLMDSDGCATTQSTAVFVNKDERLIQGLLELLRSIGLAPRLTWRDDTRWGAPVRMGRVMFRPSEYLPVFRLPRKVERIRGASKYRGRTITSITPTDSVPVKCIEVGSEDHLFVAGEGWALTHNTQHWIEANAGVEMSRAINRNLGKSRDGAARSLAIQNAHVPGEGSVAEADYDGWNAICEGRSKSAGVYYDATEAPADTDMGDEKSLRGGLLAARGDSVWLDVDRLVEEIMDTTTPVEMSRRFYLNQVVAATDSLVSAVEWDRCASDDRLAEGDEVTLGFDGGKSDDATALVAVRVSDRLVQPLAIWQAPDGPAGKAWEVDRVEVDGAVRNALATYRVSAFFADVALWESYVDQWSIDYRNDLLIKATPKSAVGWDMRSGLKDITLANERLVASVADEQISHSHGDGVDEHLRTHVLNARRRLNRFGLSFGKEHRESARKVDGYAALLLADLARSRVLASGKRRGSRKVVILS